MTNPRIRTKRLFVGFSTVDRRVPETRLYDIELVKRDLLNAFMTRRGERVMNPTFGSIVWNLLFEPFTEGIRQQVISDVQNIINQEPRVQLVDLRVTQTDQGIEVECMLNYVPFNVVDTLYAQFVRRNFGEGIIETFSEDL